MIEKIDELAKEVRNIRQELQNYLERREASFSILKTEIGELGKLVGECFKKTQKENPRS